MRTYKISFKYYLRGTWRLTTKHVKATSDMSAIAQIESMYEYVKEIRILSVN